MPAYAAMAAILTGAPSTPLGGVSTGGGSADSGAGPLGVELVVALVSTIWGVTRKTDVE